MKFRRGFGIIILVVFSLIPVSLLSQQNKNNFLGICFGVNNLHLQDEHASPLIFRNTGITPSLQFLHQSLNARQFAEVSFYYTNLRTTQDNFKTRNYGGRIMYSFVYALKFLNRNEKLNFYLGGALSSYLSRSNYYYTYLNVTDVRAITSWYWSHSVDLSVQSEYKVGTEQVITFRLFIPIVSNISRPEYSPSSNYNYTTNNWNIKTFGKSEFFPENIFFNTHLTYQRPVSIKLNVLVSYEFFYTRYSKPNDIKMYQNTFRIGLFYRF